MDSEIRKLVDKVKGPNVYLEKMLLERGDLSAVNFGIIPVHDNPYPPAGNKGIHWETGLILLNFVLAKKPINVVELGTFRGYSTSWLILGTMLNKIGRVDAYEVFPERHYGEMLYDQYGLSKDRFTYNEIPGGIWKHTHDKYIPERIDLLYHDTEHLPGPTKLEMDLLLPRVTVGGIVLIDDVLSPHYRPMQAYLHLLFNEELKYSWTYKILPIGCGLGIAERIK